MLVIERVWREKREHLLTIARSVAGGGLTAEDLLQEAFARALESKRDFEDADSVLRFLCRVLTNVAIDGHRRKRRQRRIHFNLHRSAPQPSARISAVGPLRLLVGRERDILLDSVMREVERAVEALPEKQREALDVMFGDDRRITLQELCREKGIPYSTLRSRMLKAVDLIRNRLRRKGLLENFNEVKSA